MKPSYEKWSILQPDRGLLSANRIGSVFGLSISCQNTVTIRLLDTQILDSSEYRTPILSGIQMVENVRLSNGPLA